MQRTRSAGRALLLVSALVVGLAVTTPARAGIRVTARAVVPHAAQAGSLFVPQTPTRIFDQTLAADSPLAVDVPVVGQGSPAVPSDATAVVLTITGQNPTTGTYVTAYPTPSDGSGPPYTSVLNLVPGQTAADLATVAVGANGSVRLFRRAGGLRLVVDITGYYVPAADGGAGFAASSVRRVLDTTVQAPQTVTISRAALGVPADATAVALNLTGQSPSVDTYVTAYPAGGSRPPTSSLNVSPATTRAALVVVALGPDGVSLYDNLGTMRLVADLQGWYATTGTASTYFPTSPRRTEPGVQLGPTSTVTETFGSAGVPAGASAVAVTLTSANATAETYESIYPGGIAFPGTSDVNVMAGGTAPNLVLLPLSPTGTATLLNNAGSVLDILDVSGWFVPETPGHDVSAYQCSGSSATVPTPAAFGVINPSAGGLAGSGVNPCLAQEDSWAHGTGDEAFYAPLADRGSSSGLYKTPGSAPQSCPTGQTAAQYDANPGCAYDYGWNQAASFWSYASTTGHQAATWWLDVEDVAGNWSDGSTRMPVSQNVQVLDGAADYLTEVGATRTGLYSNGDATNWPAVVGGTTAFQGLDEWVASHSTAPYAVVTSCGQSFAGGPVRQVQDAGGSVDTDYRC